MRFGIWFYIWGLHHSFTCNLFTSMCVLMSLTRNSMYCFSTFTFAVPSRGDKWHGIQRISSSGIGLRCSTIAGELPDLDLLRVSSLCGFGYFITDITDLHIDHAEIRASSTQDFHDGSVAPACSLRNEISCRGLTCQGKK